MPKESSSLNDAMLLRWPASTARAAHVLVDSHGSLRARTLQEYGYQYLAQVGHNPALRAEHYPLYIDAEESHLDRFSAGFRAVVYSVGDLLFKVGHNLSFEIQREWHQYSETMNRLAMLDASILQAFELDLGVLNFPVSDLPLRVHASAPDLSPYFRDEWVLLKKRAEGTTIRDVITTAGADCLTIESLEALASIFRQSAQAGVYLPGDPDDILFNPTAYASDSGKWTVIDPDGWVVYAPNDAYVSNAARRAFRGIFTRLLPEVEGNLKASLLGTIERAQVALDNSWPHIDAPFTEDHWRELLASGELLTSRDPRISALIRCELHDALRLDSELGRCSLNVLLTTSSLLGQLLDYRELSGSSALSGVYFGDLGVLQDGHFAAVFNSYNDADNERSGDWAYNHTGIKNEEIARLVLQDVSRRYS